MELARSDEFGISMIYKTHLADKRILFENLSATIREYGFTDFSPEGITSFLTFRYPVERYTMFKNYFAIPPGHQVKKGSIEPFWRPKFSIDMNIAFEQAMRRTEKLLISAVEQICNDKEKIGLTISGGLDSSLLCAIVRSLYPNKEIHTYSAGFVGDDEFEYSRKVSEMFNTIHKELVLCKEDFIGKTSLLKPLIKQKAAPLHPNEIALGNIEKIAVDDKCEVVLCGEGGDDIFGGYGQLLRMYLNYSGDVSFSKYFLSNYRYFSREEQKKLINEKYLIDDISLVEHLFKDQDGPQDIKDKVFYFIQRIHTPGLVIRGVNAFKYNGLPPAFPYLNMNLVDFVNSLPFDYKIHWKTRDAETKAKNMYFREVSENLDIPKYLLKRIAERYLPREIIYRIKKGFPVPFNQWLSDIETWPLDSQVFRSNDISYLDGWKKFMIINLNTFIECFRPYTQSE
jgi:asparagine synthetase B (glutamine-hydrolysing)